MEPGGKVSTPLLWGIASVLFIVLVVNVFVLGMQRGEMTTLTGDVKADVTAGGRQATVPAEERPDVELFVMSKCPYGMQMQKAFVPVMELLGPNMDAEVKWVGYLMHGAEERDENTRQYCIQELAPNKYADYLRCYLDKEDSATCQRQVGIDSSAVSSCVDEANAEFNIMQDYNNRDSWLNGRFPKYQVHQEENQAYGVRGSPTLVINGETVKAQRSPEAVKQAICGEYENPPPECQETLSSSPEQPGAGKVGASGGAAGAAPAGCGV